MIVRVLFAAVIVGVLVLAAAHNAKQLRHVHLDLSLRWLLVAAPFTFVGGVLLPLAWRHTVGAYGSELPRATAVRVWSISQASRFVPGNVALVASRVLLSAREGVPRSLAGASLGIEGGLIIVWGAFFASWLPSTWLPAPLRLLLAGGALVVLVAMPVLLRLGGRLVPRFPALAPEALRVRHLYEAIGLYGVNNLVRASGFLFVTASLHTIAPRDAWLVIGAVNLGAIIGMIGITPAGLGVREGVIAVLLAHRFGAGNAAAFAVAFRAWDFAFELLWIGIALTWERRSRATRSEVVEVAPSDVP
ncbi:MAG: glycosyltransferase 2 family protein [Solirubrobacteraceae bacterium]|nr:glycosyltransferase 2 family protein [Solirubrobacteraceae bacterium]